MDLSGKLYRYPEKKTDSGSTFSNNFMILPGFPIENLTCAWLASSTTLYKRNVAGIHEKTGCLERIGRKYRYEM